MTAITIYSLIWFHYLYTQSVYAQSLVVDYVSAPQFTKTILKVPATQSSDARYSWYFHDDSSYIETLEAETTHMFNTTGVWEVDVYIVNIDLSQPPLNITFYVSVEIEITGLAVAQQTIMTELGNATSIAANVNDGTNITWVLHTGENRVKYATDCSTLPLCSNSGKSHTFVHTYMDPGNYTANVTARNNVSEETIQVLVTVYEAAIQGLSLQLVSNSIQFGDPVNAIVLITSGTLVNFTKLLDKARLDDTDIQWTGLSGTFTISPEVYKSIGFHVLELQACNMISEDNTTVTFDVEYDIKALEASANATVLTAATDAVQFAVTASQGTGVHVTIVYGDNTVDHSSVIYNLSAQIVIFEHTYQMAGEYTVTITAINSLSSAAVVSLSLIVQNPISGSEISVVLASSLLTMYQGQPVQTTIDWAFNIGQGQVQSPTAAAINYTVWRTDCPLTSICVPVYMQGHLDFMPKSLTLYTPGSYIVNISAYNLVSRFARSFELEVDEAIEKMVVLTNPSVNLLTGETISLTASPLWGSRMLYEWSIADGSMLSSSSQSLNHTFNAPGIYNLLVTATNLVSVLPANITITVQDKITGLRLVVLSNVTSLHDITDMEIRLQQGSDITWMLDAGDSSPTAQITDVGSPGEITHTIQHTYATPGTFVVTINASNLISSSSVTSTVIVCESITGLKIATRAVNFNSSATVAVSLKSGSHVQLTIELDGVLLSDRTFEWAASGKVTISPSEYATLGHHSLIVIASNILGSETANATIAIEYGIVNLKVVASTLYARPLVNLVTFNASVDTGSAVDFVIDYGDGALHHIQWGDDEQKQDVATFTHAYSVAGHYAVLISAVNNVSSDYRTVNITIQDPVPDLDLTYSSTIAMTCNQPTPVSFFLSISSSDPAQFAPTEVEKHFSFGSADCFSTKLASPSCAPANLTASLATSANGADETIYVYDSPGTFFVGINVSNFVSFVFWNITVDVDTVIEDLTLNASHLEAAIWNVPVTLQAFAICGSRMTYSWNFGDNSSALTTTSSTVTHVYNDATNYNIIVIASNSISSETAYMTLPVQKPVASLMCSPLQPATEYKWC